MALYGCAVVFFITNYTVIIVLGRKMWRFVKLNLRGGENIAAARRRRDLNRQLTVNLIVQVSVSDFSNKIFTKNE